MIPTTSTPSSTYPSQSPNTLFTISTIAGSGSTSYSGDNGQATAAGFIFPSVIRLDAAGTHIFFPLVFKITLFFFFNLGNVYIVDCWNHRVRKVTVSSGIITTIAGSGGTGSYTGDNGQATSAGLNYPGGLSLDSQGISCI